MTLKLNLKGVLILLFLFTILMSLVNAFNVVTLSGEEIQWDNSYCQEDFEKGYSLVGDDYYVYCESDFGEEYLNVTNSFRTEENVVIQENFTETTDVDSNGNLIYDKGYVPLEKDFFLLKLIGLLILVVFILLIVVYEVIKYKDETKRIHSLIPYINTLRSQGYTKDQIEMALIQKGYQGPFINKLMNEK